jgi:hypothetical protein
MASSPDYLDPDELIELTEKLRDLGVSAFSWGNIKVEFREGLATVKAMPLTKEQRQEEPKPVPIGNSVYHNPKLWGGAEPPTFPKAGA